MPDYTQQNITIPPASPAMAMMQGAAYALQLEQENKQLRDQLYAVENPPNRPQKKVLIAGMLYLLKLAGINLSNTDRSKIARLIAFFIGHRDKQVLKVIEEDKDFSECHDKDLQQMDKLLTDVGLKRLGA